MNVNPKQSQSSAIKELKALQQSLSGRATIAGDDKNRKPRQGSSQRTSSASNIAALPEALDRLLVTSQDVPRQVETLRAQRPDLKTLLGRADIPNSLHHPHP
jgi:hypothetical protein